MELPKINCHIHSKFSDGSNNIDEIVKKSVKLSMDFISITDHLSNSWKSNLIPTLDNSIKIDTYLKAINKTNLYLEETNQKLRLLKGVEIDISSDKQYILRLINPKEFDIILFEYVESYEGLAFVSNIINYWKHSFKKETKLPLFGLAHLEPSYFYYGNFNRLVEFIAEYTMFYEFNTSYPESYSSKYQDFYNRLKGRDIMFSIGSDSHEIESISNIEIPLRMLEFYELQNNYLRFFNNLEKFFLKQK